MIICPNCQNKEMSGAIYCGKCGAQLIEMSMTTHKIHTAETRGEAERNTGRTQVPPPVHLQSWISLNMMESGQILPLADRNEFSLGRSAEGQPIVPDVDLTPYGAYTNGVSRLHAVLKRVGDRIVLMDLGSSNGTYLNGTRLAPYIEMAVAHGDVVYLGKLKLQILVE
jgi:hypothetical protein